jgi:hypothetical protein
MPGPVLPPAGPAQPYPGLQLTALDIISSALRLIGVLAAGETAPGYQANIALQTLNQLVDSLSAERLMIWSILRNLYTLTAGVQTYQLGPSTPATFATTLDQQRYVRLERAGIIYLGNALQPLELPMEVLTEVGWAAIPVKAIASTLPQYLYDDKAFPQRNLNFWPFPDVSTQVALYLWTPLTFFPDLTTQFTFPPAYIKMLRYNLAIDLAAEWPGNPATAAAIFALAKETKGVVKSFNVEPVDMRCDAALTAMGINGLYDWRSDQPVGGRNG